MTYIEGHRMYGLVVRVLALHAGGSGFDPGPRHTKDVKNGTHCFSAKYPAIKRKSVGSNTQCYKKD